MEKLQKREGLLFVSVTLIHNGATQNVDNVILDTGAAQSIIDMNTVESMDIAAEREDSFVFLTGLGGQEPALRKRIDCIQFDTYEVRNEEMDFAFLDAHPGINGLLGLDILIPGHFVIDLSAMEIYQKK